MSRAVCWVWSAVLRAVLPGLLGYDDGMMSLRPGAPNFAPVVVAPVLGIFLGMAMLGSATPARAYCLQRSCDADSDPQTCSRGPDGCSNQGQAVRRPNGCITVSVRQGAGDPFGMRDVELEAIVREAFAKWQNARCPGGGTPAIDVRSLGVLDIPEDAPHPHTCNLDDANIDSWTSGPIAGSSGTFVAGLTWASFFVRDGEEVYPLVDADVILNRLLPSRAAALGDELKAILATVAAHEAGHALGIAHSTDREALMFPEDSFSRNRGLSADDLAAVCALFPPEDFAEALDCVEPRIFDAAFTPEDCDAELERRNEVVQTSGCAVASGGRNGRVDRAQRRQSWVGMLPVMLVLLGLGIGGAGRKRSK